MSRPVILSPLFAAVSGLRGVGVATVAQLARLLCRKPEAMPLVRDVVFHLPVAVIDRRFSPPLHSAPEGVVASFEVRIISHHPPPRGRKNIPYRILCENATGRLNLAYFQSRADYLKTLLPEGEERVVSGKVEFYSGLPQIAHPDYVLKPADKWQVMRVEPVYRLVAGLSNRQLCRIQDVALAQLPALPEWLDLHYIRQQGWQGWRESLNAAHRPDSPHALEAGSARQRLAYDELLAHQLALALVRRHHRTSRGVRVQTDGALRQKIESSLPFTLTSGQQQVLDEIRTDMCSGGRMLRLLQGDVGSGKTVVAVLAMAEVVEMGKQAALMAPTDILARQHAAWCARWLQPLGVRVELLTGKTGSAKTRESIRQRIAAGEVDIVIGTHALFQDTVRFDDLALVVVDEQHRFGVEQRMQLAGKAVIAPHILLMTATPIPRSLTMTLFGDMESSVLKEKPAGRQAIDTRAMPLEKTPEIIAALHRALAEGNKIYWICPLVEEADNSDPESNKADLAAAEARYKTFLAEFGERVGLVHGRMKPDEREPVMQGFAGDRFDILVATTVVEVGVDVPEATIMVIEHAERFGLSQLHQLRGRVGRGSRKSSCILLYRHPPGDIGEQRLRIMRETEDGFRIAEEDMRLRGAGDVLGTRQSGMPEFHFADLARDTTLALAARDDVKLVLHQDAQLATPRGEALRILLYLFSHDEHIRYLRSG